MSLRAGLRVGLVLLGLAAACGPDLEKQSQVKRTRVLAVKAEPPELLLLDGGSPPVRFSALAVSPNGIAPTVSFALCPPGDPYTQALDCPGDAGVPLLQDTLDPAVLETWSQRYAGLAALDAGVNDFEQGTVQATVGYLAVSNAHLAGNGISGDVDSERGLYRLAVRTAGTPNQNPVLLDVTVDGGSLEGAILPERAEVVLTPRLLDGGVETYMGRNGEPTFENLFYSWAATGEGDVKDSFSREPTPADPAETAFSKYGTPDAGPVTFYVVVRDGRGGTDWKIFTATVDGGSLVTR